MRKKMDKYQLGSLNKTSADTAQSCQSYQRAKGNLRNCPHSRPDQKVLQQLNGMWCPEWDLGTKAGQQIKLNKFK